MSAVEERVSRYERTHEHPTIASYTLLSVPEMTAAIKETAAMMHERLTADDDTITGWIQDANRAIRDRRIPTAVAKMMLATIASDHMTTEEPDEHDRP